MTIQRSMDAPVSAPRGTGHHPAALPVIVAGSFITTLDFFIVNVAIPSMQRTLHASAASVQWMVAGFALALACGLITGGRLGDLYGRRRMFIAGLALFGVHQRRRARMARMPLIDLGIFRGRAFTAGVALGCLFFAGMASFFLVLTLYLQQGRGLGALGAGAVFTPMGASYLATTLYMQRLTGLLGRQALAIGGLVIAAGQAGLLVTTGQLGLSGSTWLMTPALLVIGAGMGMVVAPLSAMVLAAAGPRHAGSASGVLSTAQNVGNALGVAVIGVVFFGALGAGRAGFPHALESSVAWLAVVGVAVAAGVQLLPARRTVQ